MSRPVYFGDMAYCRAHQHDGYRLDGLNHELEAVIVNGDPDRVTLSTVTVPPSASDHSPLLLFPAEYADLVAMELVRAQLPYLSRREGFAPGTPWFVVASYLEDKETPSASREALLLRLAFEEDRP